MSQSQIIAHQKRRKKAMEYVKNNWAISDNIPTGNSLYDEAYNYYMDYFGFARGITTSAPGWNGIISYIRHRYTNYEELLRLASILAHCSYQEVHDDTQIFINEVIEDTLADDDKLTTAIDTRNPY